MVLLPQEMLWPTQKLILVKQEEEDSDRAGNAPDVSANFSSVQAAE